MPTSVGHTALGEAQDKLQSIQSAARDFLTREWSTRQYRLLETSPSGFSEDLWQQIKGMGWPGILVPEDQGGAGGTFHEFCGMVEELGRANAPTPLIETVLCSHILRRSSNTTLQNQTLPSLVGGESLVVRAFRGPELSTDPLLPALRASSSPAGVTLNGTAMFVPFATTARALLFGAQADDGPLLCLVDTDSPGVTITRLRVLDWSPLSEVSVAGVEVSSGRIVARGGQARVLLEEAQLVGSLAASIELIGVARAALDLAVEYAGNRVAFGRPIGAFQGVKHKLVNLRADLEVGRALCYGAALDVSAEAEERLVSTSMAAFWAADSLRRVPEGALQVFGGVGFTWEHDIHLYLKRTATLAALLGEVAVFREPVVQYLESRYA
jgi:alkylation response protein AidB-like acyl-CoA dehydrogenase